MNPEITIKQSTTLFFMCVSEQILVLRRVPKVGEKEVGGKLNIMDKIIGNWIIQTDGIKWIGIHADSVNLFIQLSSLDEICKWNDNDDNVVYDWLVHLTEKTWLTVLDIEQLNKAFVIAMKKYNKNIDFDIYCKTMEIQEELKDK